MTRECSLDFKRVESYISGYRIDANLTHPPYCSALKLMHKAYFSLLSWHVEFISDQDKFKQLSGGGDDSIQRLHEAVSDIGSSFFNWINGNYKASRIMLRVSIENFVRAVSAIEEPAQNTETSVYRLFDVARTLPIFCSISSVLTEFESLHSDYGLLCGDAHTANISNMAHLSSLADLPMFDLQKAKNTQDIYLRVVKNMIAILCTVFNRFYLSMHHRNKENVLNGLSSNLRKQINSLNASYPTDLTTS